MPIIANGPSWGVEHDDPLPELPSPVFMKNQWVIQCVGTSEEDQAHLRLLLRSARKLVSEDWAWGPESEAHLLVMDKRSQIGDVALERASQDGVASAQLIDAEAPGPSGLFLRRPLHREAFAALLNIVAHGDIAAASASSDQPQPENETVAPVAAQADPTGDDPQGPTPSAIDPLLPSTSAAEPTVDENIMRSLLHYLPKRALGGPAQIALPDAPQLVIDPDTRMFWAEGPLPALEPYVRQQLRFGDWKHLGSNELDQARQGLTARPHAYLIWMDGYLHSRGVLSRRFDPDGTYSLTKRLDLATDYPRALRISAQMNRPRTLEQIARASGVELAEVFDVVNAYEAIGYLEWTRRK